MNMDPNFGDLHEMTDEFDIHGCFHGLNIKTLLNDDYPYRSVQSDPTIFQQNSSPDPLSSITANGDSHEDLEMSSDIALRYISQILLEEDIEDKLSLIPESPALQAAEKPFYEIFGEKFHPSFEINFHQVDGKGKKPEENGNSCSSDFSYLRANMNSSNKTTRINDVDELGHSLYEFHNHSYSSPPYSISNSVENVSDESWGSSSMIGDPNLQCVNQPIWHFNRGVEEAKKFLPNGNSLLLKPEENALFLNLGLKEEANLNVKAEKKDKRELSVNSFKGKKNVHREDLDSIEEGRRLNKQSALSYEESVRSEMFDRVLLCHSEDDDSHSIINLTNVHNEGGKDFSNGELKKSSSKPYPNYDGLKKSLIQKSRRKKDAKKEVVDLRTLLIHCAQAVASDDHRRANELLKQIRQYSSPFGDGSQRLAHCFADGLEARMAGTGSQIYSTCGINRKSAKDLLKAFHLFLLACPFRKLSHIFANWTILNAAEKASKIHVIDFGIYFGFQWPCLMHRLSLRSGGPPKLRITGVDFPQPGLRPSQRVQETGARLADYAKSFNVPFEYNAIACKWENIRAEDLKICVDDVLIVNCLYQLRHIVDETVVVDSPRDIVLNLIRTINPHVFIHGIVNGAYSAPFFVTRFREALFHFSSLFDMLETNVPRENPERILIEREIFGHEALNVIACEGLERIERPETYKNWQVRNHRAGLMQLSLNPSIIRRLKDMVKNCYHKDFVIDVDSQWMLQGWKGRIIYALSTWKTDKSS